MSPYCKSDIIINPYNSFIIKQIIRAKLHLYAIFKTLLHSMELINQYEEANFIIWYTVFGEFSIQPGIQTGEDRQFRNDLDAAGLQRKRHLGSAYIFGYY